MLIIALDCGSHLVAALISLLLPVGLCAWDGGCNLLASGHVGCGWVAYKLKLTSQGTSEFD